MVHDGSDSMRSDESSWGLGFHAGFKGVKGARVEVI